MSVPSEFGVREIELEEIVIPNDLTSARRSEERIMWELARNQFTSDDTFAIKLALEEALTNAVKHGNHNDASKRVVIRYAISRVRAVIMVRDEGCGFSPHRVPDPTADENLERPSGRGIMLMHAYMTRVRFNETGNEVWLLKENRDYRPSAAG
jgi:serine/threonine-protein kinase RsbW